MPLGRPVYNPRPDVATSIAQGTRFSAVPNAPRAQDWQDVIEIDPNLAGMSPAEATNYLRAAWGLPNTYKLDANGQIVDTHGFLVRNLWWIGPAAIVGGAAIGAAAGGGGGSAAAGSLGATGGGSGAAGSLGAAGAASGAGGGAAASSGFWSPGTMKLLDVGVGLGTQAWANHRQGRAEDRALQFQERAYRDAQEEARLQREEERRRWDVDQANREPYRQMSRAALNNLGGLLGLSGGGGGSMPSGWMSPSNVGRQGYDAYGRSLGDLLERR